MPGTGAASTAMTLALAGHQVAKASQKGEGIQWLLLGALMGIFYVLCTEKYLRVMQHRHLYVRISMLILGPLGWIGAAVALTFICVNIRHQTPDKVEGFERVLGALIPAVVRADLIVDWARRFALALLNVRYWTGAMVQFQRVLARAQTLPCLTLSGDSCALVQTSLTAPSDCKQAEKAMWGEDADALVQGSEIRRHFRRLARVTIHGTLKFLGAIPSAVVWILHSAHQGSFVYAAFSVVTVLCSPFSALIVLIGSSILVASVVTLSVAGTFIQFFVYWSIRVMYSMIRAALSRQWTGFPFRTAYRGKGDSADVGSVVQRAPDEAGAAMARMGALLPTELECALASWDGSVWGDAKRADDVDHLFENDGEGQPDKKQDSESASDGGLYSLMSVVSGIQRSSSSGSEPASDKDRPAGGQRAASSGSESDSRTDRDLALMARIGLDAATDTRHERRMSTYYMLGMFVHMQVESGGKAWCLGHLPDLSHEKFQARLAALDSFMVIEAAEAGDELSNRLGRMSKYRIVHSGSKNEDVVPVRRWIRALLLFLLEAY